MSKLIIYDNLEVTRDIPKNFLEKDLELFEHEYLRKIDYSYIKINLLALLIKNILHQLPRGVL